VPRPRRLSIWRVADVVPVHQFGPWPTGEHRLLLRAALQDAGEALPSWDAWRAQHDLAAIDTGALRLLPLVYRNLTRFGVEPASLGRVRGVYRQTWYRNQLIVGTLADLVGALEAQGIQTLVLKGVPLALQYYGDIAVRPMADADLLVPVARARDAFRVVTAAGWRPQDTSAEWPPRFTGSRAFTNTLGLEMDLHTHVMHEWLQPDADAELWQRAMPFRLGSVETRALSAADQLLHVVTHGFRRSTVPPVRWVADAVTIIRHAQVDWACLVSLAAARRFGRVAAAALDYVRTSFGVDVPSDAIAALRASSTTVVERLEYWSRVEPGRLQLGVEAWCEYRRAIGREPRWVGPLGFVRYLQDRLGVERLRQLPSAAAAKMSPRRFEAAMLRPIQK